MMTLGAHEVLELHEILSDSIHSLNTLKLYRPHAKDHQLLEMMDRHANAMMMEYNNLIQLANYQGASHAVPTRSINRNQAFQPTYGLRSPQHLTPAGTISEIDDIDVTLCLINCHKQTASVKMKAALEMANPMLRSTIQQGANTSADMAYEAFQYANQRGYYQVPVLKDKTQYNFTHAYETGPMTTTNSYRPDMIMVEV